MTETKKQDEISSSTTGVVEPITFAEFLETVPPSQVSSVTGVFLRKAGPGLQPYYELETPQLFLHCTNDRCNGQRFFRFNRGDRLVKQNEKIKLAYLTYVCSNCQRNVKIFSLHIAVGDLEEATAQCYKFGELPTYGPPTPARLIRLFGKEREIFLKGRRCENQGLGIGAFVYYRRVVENQKNAILDEIIRVSEKIGAPELMIKTLQDAKREVQFSRALASVKDALPEVLFVNGHNPLTLLHSALSNGLHESSDERCLELAHDIRVLLVELAERLGAALKDEAELNAAVTRLLNVDQSKRA